MTKITRNIILVLILLIGLFPAFRTTAGAETNEAKFQITVEDPICITVTWETGDISIELQTPSGKTISPENIPKDAKVIRQGNAYYFIFMQPETGEWIARYDKGSNELIHIYGDYYLEPMWITEFTASKPDVNGNINASFFVDGKGAKKSFNYELSLALASDSTVSKPLASGYAYSDETCEKSVNIADSNSSDQYILKLRITYDQQGYQYYDVADSEVLSYANTSNPDVVLSFEVILSDGGTAQVILTPVDSYNVDGYVVTLFENDDQEPSDTLRLGSGETTGYIVYNINSAKLRIDASTVDDGIFSAPNTKNIDLAGLLSGEVAFSFPETAAVNSSEYLLPYTRGGGKEATVTLNSVENKLTLEQEGKLQLSLAEGYNSIKIVIAEPGGVYYSLEKNLVCDTYGPQLFVYEDIDGIVTTEKTFTILGNVEPSSALTCNGQAVEVGADGEYRYDVPLKSGKNPVELMARDAVGNTASYSATITRKVEIDLNNPGYFPLILGLIAALILIFTCVCAGKAKKPGRVNK